jgi:hypothetical protein
MQAGSNSISSCLPAVLELSQCGSDRDAEYRYPTAPSACRASHGHVACVSGGLTFDSKS